MADLTARLGLTEGTNRVIDDPASPSAVGAVMDFAKDALAGYSSLKDDLSKKAANKRAAEERATQAQIAFDVTGVPAAASADVATSRAQVIQSEMRSQPGYGEEAPPTNKPLGSVFEEAPASVSPAMERDVVGSAKRAASVVAAVEQGKMPAISIQAAVTARFRALREKYPEHTEYLLDMWKKQGLDGVTSPEIGDAEFEHKTAREAAAKAQDVKVQMRNDAIKTARETLGPDALTMSDDALEIHGLTAMRDANDLRMLATRAEIEAKQAGMSKEAAQEAGQNLNEAIEANFQNQIYNQAGPVINTVIGLADSLLKNPTDPDALQRWQANGVRIKQMIPQIAENALQQAIAAGYKGDPEKFKARITSIYGPLTDAFTGEHSVVKANADTLTGIENSFKITRAQALPIMMSLQSAGMKPAEMPAVIRAVETNPQLQKDLQAEVNGFVKDWGKDRASTRVLNMIKLFRGEASLSQLTGPAARAAVTDLSVSIVPLARGYVQDKGVEGNKVVHTTGELAVAATSLTPSSGSGSYLLATRGFAGEGTRKALIKALSDPSVDREMALATVQASRASSAHLLNNVKVASERANANSPYFKMVWDPQNGVYKIDRSGYRRALAEARSRMGGLRGAGVGLETGAANYARLSRTKEPEEITNLIMSANVNLANAVELGKHDPSTPKATDIQLRNWYGRDKPIPGEGAAKAPINPQKEIDKQLDNLDDMITQTLDVAVSPVKLPAGPGERRVKNMAGKDVVVPAINNIVERFTGNANFEAIRQSARQLGVPEEVAIRLGWVESGGSFADNLKPNSAGAMGPIQTVPKYQNPLAQQLFGKNIPELTPAQMITVGMTYLKNEYIKHGNWNDAISAYHSGGPLSKRGKSHDGNIYTRDYVALIGG